MQEMLFGDIPLCDANLTVLGILELVINHNVKVA